MMEAEETLPSETPKRILVVEDDVDLCMLIDRVLSDMDADLQVQFASTVHEAAMWLDDQQRFDLVLADFLLADSRNGYELREVCEERAPDCAFVMMSAMPLGLPKLREEEFLQKPFSGSQCMEFLESTLARL